MSAAATPRDYVLDALKRMEADYEAQIAALQLQVNRLTEENRRLSRSASPTELPSFRPNRTLEFILTGIAPKTRMPPEGHPPSTLSAFKVLQETYMRNRSAFSLSSLYHISGEDTRPHLTIAHDTVNPSGHCHTYYYHVYYEGERDRPRFTEITGVDAKGTRYTLAYFTS